MTKSSQKKGQNYIPFLNLHTLKCKEKHPHARAARAPPAPGGQGGSGGTPERRSCTQPPDTFFEFTYSEMQRKHIPRVNEYQS